MTTLKCFKRSGGVEKEHIMEKSIAQKIRLFCTSPFFPNIKEKKNKDH